MTSETTDTKATEKKATENKKPETSTSDNKALFGPLGKYAVIAVIMVSVIVTTAIMLDKQLSKVDEQIAVIEDEVSGLNTVTASASENITATTAEADISTDEVTASATVETQTEIADNDVTAVETVSATELNETVKPITEKTAQVSTTEATTSTIASTETPVKTGRSQARQSQLAMENQARIDAYKAEQKQHMTKMFARIKTLEAQQLDQYKVNQDKRVERLRAQITHQQQVIEALILRNEESLKMRAASVQKHQASREQMLNRI